MQLRSFCLSKLVGWSVGRVCCAGSRVLGGELLRAAERRRPWRKRNVQKKQNKTRKGDRYHHTGSCVRGRNANRFSGIKNHAGAYIPLRFSSSSSRSPRRIPLRRLFTPRGSLSLENPYGPASTFRLERSNSNDS